MRFAYFTAGTPEWEPAEAARILSRQGWDGVEWRVTDDPGAGGGPPSFWRGNRSTWPLTGLENNLETMRTTTEQYGLAVPCLGASVRCFQREDVERVLAATARLGVSQARILVPTVEADETYPDAFAKARHDFTWVAERAAAHGVKALVELHFGLLTASASAAFRLVDGLDPAHIGVIHDMGNMINEGWERPLWTAQLLGPYLAHVHVKNGRWIPGEPRDDGTVDHTFTMATLRGGQADLRSYLADLAAGGYDGWVTCEDFSTEVPLEQRTADNLAYLRECAP